MKKIFLLALLQSIGVSLFAEQILIPMDSTQKNHLKAYGAIYHSIAKDNPVDWLLNYRGGSYLLSSTDEMRSYLTTRGISFESIEETEAENILVKVNEDEMMGIAHLELLPKIALYTSENETQWDDAVFLALKYAEIPFDLIKDPEVLSLDLSKYNWIHMHHEDFTGQQGKFAATYGSTDWFKKEISCETALAAKYGFSSVPALKWAVAKKLKEFVKKGGHLFGMCSATDSYDIALASGGMEIAKEYEKGSTKEVMNGKLNYDNTFAFTGFSLRINPRSYEFSNIDTYETRAQKGITKSNDYFTIHDFSAKTDIAASMASQDHQTKVKGFWGQTVAFNKQFIKPDVTIISENADANESRCLFGAFGKGTWTFYAGHDPEQYQHRIGDPASDLSKTPNSPGYRLILNNIFLPSVKPPKETKNVLSRINIFPNPVKNGDFEVSFNCTGDQPASIKIFSLNGKLIMEKNVLTQTGNNQYKIQLDGIASGIYQIEFSSKGFSETRKLVVED